eukprot:6109063-Amphidinium_carterae.1
MRRARRQRFYAELFYRSFAATLPDMDARDAMKGEALMADVVEETHGSRLPEVEEEYCEMA